MSGAEPWVLLVEAVWLRRATRAPAADISTNPGVQEWEEQQKELGRLPSREFLLQVGDGRIVGRREDGGGGGCSREIGKGEDGLQ